MDIVADLGVTDTRRVLDYWRQSVDSPGTIADQTEQQDLRGISASRGLAEMVWIDGWMTTLAGKLFRPPSTLSCTALS